MLVLTRKLQEQIQVGDDITITILRVKGNTVRVGIEAPRHVRVVRGELPQFEVDLPIGSDVAEQADASGEPLREANGAAKSSAPRPKAAGVKPCVALSGAW